MKRLQREQRGSAATRVNSTSFRAAADKIYSRNDVTRRLSMTQKVQSMIVKTNQFRLESYSKEIETWKLSMIAKDSVCRMAEPSFSKFAMRKRMRSARQDRMEAFDQNDGRGTSNEESVSPFCSSQRVWGGSECAASSWNMFSRTQQSCWRFTCDEKWVEKAECAQFSRCRQTRSSVGTAFLFVKTTDCKSPQDKNINKNKALPIEMK